MHVNYDSLEMEPSLLLVSAEESHVIDSVSVVGGGIVSVPSFLPLGVSFVSARGDCIRSVSSFSISVLLSSGWLAFSLPVSFSIPPDFSSVISSSFLSFEISSRSVSKNVIISGYQLDLYSHRYKM